MPFNSTLKKVIITGVSGQVGSYMAEFCLKQGLIVFGLVRENDLNYRHLLDNKNFYKYNIDIIDKNGLDELIKYVEPDYFINFAAQSSPSKSFDSPYETLNCGTNGVLNCLESIRQHAPKCRFYNAGSSDQFGRGEKGKRQNEQTVFNPISPYGISKCMAHELVILYRKKYNLYAVQGIVFNHESERRNENFVSRKITKNVARIFYEISGGKKITPFYLGNINVERDWSHVSDVVDAVWRMLNQDIVNLYYKFPRDYVISSDKSYSIRDFVSEAFNTLEIKTKWIRFYNSTDGECRHDEKLILEKDNSVLVNTTRGIMPNDYIKYSLGDSYLIRAQLNWQPKINFKELIKKMVVRDVVLGT